MNHYLLKLSVAALSVVIMSISTPAWATSYTSVTYDNLYSGIGVYLNGKKTSVSTVSFSVGLKEEDNLENVRAFCVEPAQHAALGTKINLPVDLVTPSAVNGGLQAAWLIDYAMNTMPDLYTNKTKVAALQLSVWEVITEQAGPYDMFKGDFRAASQSAPASQASSLLLALNQNFGNADLTYLNTHFAIAQNPNKQDFILVGVNANPTPEPSTMILMAIGVMLMGGGGFARLLMKSRFLVK